jgi:hypothetical protein
MNISTMLKSLKLIDNVLFEGDKDSAHVLILKLIKRLKDDGKTN